MYILQVLLHVCNPKGSTSLRYGDWRHFEDVGLEGPSTF